MDEPYPGPGPVGEQVTVTVPLSPYQEPSAIIRNGDTITVCIPDQEPKRYVVESGGYGPDETPLAVRRGVAQSLTCRLVDGGSETVSGEH